jgi:uncharacterized protein YggE
MLFRIWARCLTFLTLLFVIPTTVMAQGEGKTGQVSGTGTVVIKRRPDVLRMQVQLAAHGKDVKEALAKMKMRRDAVRGKLVELGANKDSIEMGEPRAANDESSRQRQVQMMVRERMRQQGRRAPKTEDAKPVNLSIDLKAEWPLTGNDAEQVFLKSYEIQQKVTAELTKLRAAEDVSPEDEELAEEMAQNMGFDDGQPKPGEPSFVYAARISNEEINTALSAAFAKAKEQAQQLSQIAGAKLGPLEQLVSHESLADVENHMGAYRNNPYLYQALLQQQNPHATNDGPKEAVGIDPAQVALSVSVVASFGLGK